MSHDFARSQRIRKESPQQRSPKRKKRGGIPSWLWLLVGTLVGCLIMFLVYLSGVRPPLPMQASTAAPHAPAASSASTAEQPPAPPKRVSPVFEFYTKLPEGGQPVTDIAPATQPAQLDTKPAVQPAASQQPATSTTTVAQPAATTAMPATEPVTKEPAKAEPATAAQQQEELDPMQQLLAQKELERKEKAQKEKAASASKPAVEAASSGARYLQAGVFRNKAEAEKLRGKMSRLGVSTSVRAVSGAHGAALQKVLAGPFRSSAEADNARMILSGNGISTIAVK